MIVVLPLIERAPRHLDSSGIFNVEIDKVFDYLYNILRIPQSVNYRSTLLKLVRKEIKMEQSNF